MSCNGYSQLLTLLYIWNELQSQDFVKKKKKGLGSDRVVLKEPTGETSTQFPIRCAPKDSREIVLMQTHEVV